MRRGARWRWRSELGPPERNRRRPRAELPGMYAGRAGRRLGRVYHLRQQRPHPERARSRGARRSHVAYQGRGTFAVLVGLVWGALELPWLRASGALGQPSS